MHLDGNVEYCKDGKTLDWTNNKIMTWWISHSNSNVEIYKWFEVKGSRLIQFETLF